jgi:transposase-like protein
LALRQAESDKVTDICRRLSVSEQTFYRWKKQFAGVGMQERRKLRSLPRKQQTETARRRPSRSIATSCRRSSQKSCKASRTVHPGGVDADNLPSEPAPGREADSGVQRHAAKFPM